jgi:hypothetical protein
MIHVLDELSVRPGCLGEVRRHVRQVYEPAAASLGMTLAHTWIAPAVELLDEPTDLLLLWALDDTAAFWRARTGAFGVPAVESFWADVTPLLARRRRRIMADPDDDTIMR